MGHSILPITISVVVDDIADMLVDYDQIQIYRSTSGEDGPFAELTRAATRLELMAGVSLYAYTDVEGSAAYYYRFRFFNSTTLATSPFSDPEPGALPPALGIIGITELKTNYLFGLDLTDDAGRPYPDSMFAHFIKSAVTSLEHRLDMPILPREIEEERHDFFREEYTKYGWLKLDEYPVIDVQEVRLVLPGEQVAQVFDPAWIHIRKESGQLQLVPGTGTAGTILLGASGAWIPTVLTRYRAVPDVFRVKYRAGFELGKVPDDFKDVIGKIACFGPLNIAGDLLGGAGIASQSIGIDGLSQSFNTTNSATNAGYGARLLQYQKEIKEVLPMLRRTYKGLPLMVG